MDYARRRSTRALLLLLLPLVATSALRAQEESASSALEQALARPSSKGLLVLDIVAGSPAEEAGLLPGDIVVSVCGAVASDRETLAKAIRDGRDGRIRLEVRRGETSLAVVIASGDRLGIVVFPVSGGEPVSLAAALEYARRDGEHRSARRRLSLLDESIRTSAAHVEEARGLSSRLKGERSAKIDLVARGREGSDVRKAEIQARLDKARSALEAAKTIVEQIERRISDQEANGHQMIMSQGLAVLSAESTAGMLDREVAALRNLVAAGARPPAELAGSQVKLRRALIDLEREILAQADEMMSHSARIAELRNELAQTSVDLLVEKLGETKVAREFVELEHLTLADESLVAFEILQAETALRQAELEARCWEFRLGASERRKRVEEKRLAEAAEALEAARETLAEGRQL